MRRAAFPRLCLFVALLPSLGSSPPRCPAPPCTTSPSPACHHALHLVDSPHHARSRLAELRPPGCAGAVGRSSGEAVGAHAQEQFSCRQRVLNHGGRNEGGEVCVEQVLRVRGGARDTGVPEIDEAAKVRSSHAAHSRETVAFTNLAAMHAPPRGCFCST